MGSPRGAGNSWMLFKWNVIPAIARTSVHCVSPSVAARMPSSASTINGILPALPSSASSPMTAIFTSCVTTKALTRGRSKPFALRADSIQHRLARAVLSSCTCVQVLPPKRSVAPLHNFSPGTGLEFSMRETNVRYAGKRPSRIFPILRNHHRIRFSSSGPRSSSGVRSGFDAACAALLAAVLVLFLIALVPRAQAGDSASGDTPKLNYNLSKSFIGGLPITQLTQDEAILHALNRLAYGPRPGDVDRIRSMGLEKWSTQQLNFDSIDDSAIDARLSGFETLRMSSAKLLEKYPPPNQVAKK